MTRQRPRRSEVLKIIGLPGRTDAGKPADLVVFGGKDIYLRERLFEILVVIAIEAMSRIDGDVHLPTIASKLHISTDAARKRIKSLSQVLLQDSNDTLPILEPLGDTWWLFNLDPRSISFDTARLLAHRLDVVRGAVQSLPSEGPAESEHLAGAEES